jgi:death on curing protein
MMRVEDVITIHQILITKFGGTTGIRDRNALESALARPFAAFGDKDLYPEPADKAAAVFESLINNHPFIDGNKRISYVVCRLLLIDYGMDIKATETYKYEFVIAAASGQLRFDDIRDWLLAHVISVES